MTMAMDWFLTINGVLNGSRKSWYENGNIRRELTYSNGKIEGLVKKYNEEGKLIEEKTFINGKLSN